MYALGRAVRNRAYWRTLPQRLGILPASFKQTGSGAIWLHAVSVGEVLTSIELLARLRAEFPASPLFVSTTTLAGRAIADQKLAALADGVFYAPADFAFAVRRALRTLRPAVVIVAETEIWPNLYREVKRSGAGLLLVNARMSDRAAPSYTRRPWFFRHVLQWPDLILTQSDADRDRYLAAGAPPDRVRIGGNLKYDFQPSPLAPALDAFLDRLGAAQIWIAASTMPPDEDDSVIDAFLRLKDRYPRLLLILAPRKPERFDDAAGRLDRAGAPYIRRSRLDAGASLALPGVLLLDSIGDLGALFQRASAVFMGGSLVAWGGHNLLEPGIFGKPCLVGPYMQNFREMAAAFREAGALLEVSTSAELADAVARLFDDPKLAARIGARARECTEARRGATAAAVREVRRLFDLSVPRYVPSLPALLALWPIERLWFLAGAVHR
ncbi:MAG: 3-deoxy-D-manno-octulosonic acid transferase, partial [Bryobacteraceae bacterium]